MHGRRQRRDRVDSRLHKRIAAEGDRGHPNGGKKYP
jgi:hypothetical protein